MIKRQNALKTRKNGVFVVFFDNISQIKRIKLAQKTSKKGCFKIRRF